MVFLGFTSYYQSRTGSAGTSGTQELAAPEAVGS